jgi:tRNA pseudouridine13 synthase
MQKSLKNTELKTSWIYPINVRNEFVFNPSTKDFIVDEIPLYEFTGEGEHLVLKVRKKDLTTWEMLDIISSHLGIKKRDIGYAGLKDKNAMTMQYISIMGKYEEKLESFSHSKIKIVEKVRHNNKIRVGHLKGNKFHIRLKRVFNINKTKLESSLQWISNNGVPNYFGHQRFGRDGNNWIDGKKLIDGELKIRDRKTKDFLINSYQSYLFNNWLSKRIEISLLLSDFSEKDSEKVLNLEENLLEGCKQQEQFLKILKGDLMMHYPYGRVFDVEDLQTEAQRFKERDISPTGLLAGGRVKTSSSYAWNIEKNYDTKTDATGSRRYAWIFVNDIEGNYNEDKNWYELSFTLPKGSYATNVLDVLRGGK